MMLLWCHGKEVIFSKIVLKMFSSKQPLILQHSFWVNHLFSGDSKFELLLQHVLDIKAMLTYTTHKLESIEKKLNMPQLENILPPVPLRELIQLEELENLLIINGKKVSFIMYDLNEQTPEMLMKKNKIIRYIKKRWIIIQQISNWSNISELYIDNS